MVGLRKREPRKFERYFKLVQDEAAKRNCIYYLDAGDGKDIITKTLWCSDLSGWLIPNTLPKEKIAEFEEAWKSSAVNDEWFDYFMFVTYENPQKPKIVFLSPTLYD